MNDHLSTSTKTCGHGKVIPVVILKMKFFRLIHWIYKYGSDGWFSLMIDGVLSSQAPHCEGPATQR